jgi:branched-chain amino acid transport system permease protein
MEELPRLLLGGLKIGAIYSLAALGIVVIHKATRTVNFAHGAFIMLGAYFGFFLLRLFDLPYALVYLLAPVAVGALAAGTEWLFLRRLRRSDPFNVVISTIFIGLAATELIRVAYRSDLLSMPRVWSGPPLLIGDLILTRETLWIILGALCAAAAGALLFAAARFGRAMRAMAANVVGAQLCGYSVHAVYAQAWFLGGTLAGLAGLFLAPVMGITPELADIMIVPAFVAAILGGFDSIKGAVLGGIVLGLVETFSAAYLSSAGKSALTFMILLAVLLWRPRGLFPESRIRDV